jgi:ribA/ribD-fused uncharacterized protein
MVARDVTGRPPLTVAALVEKITAGWKPDFLFFWGHRAKQHQGIGKHVLSQWWPAAFEAGGVRYATAEHFMMAEKARLFGDAERLAMILAAETPDRAKALGRKVQGFDGAVWDAAAFDIVVRGNLAKFGGNDALRGFLLATGDRVIVEASPVDAIWGIGMAETDPRAGDPAQWPGRNLLGFALMAARAEFGHGGIIAKSGLPVFREK